MVVIQLQKDEKTEQLLDSLQDHFKELQDEASQMRKEGKDTTIPDLIMIDFMPKVKLARTTYEKKDIDAVKKTLAQVRHELDVVKTGSEFDSVLSRIQKAYDLIREGKRSEAREIYDELRRAYTQLNGDMKQIVYKASLDIHERLTHKDGP